MKVELVCSLTVEFGKITMPSCLGRSRLTNSGCELIDHILQEVVHHLAAQEKSILVQTCLPNSLQEFVNLIL